MRQNRLSGWTYGKDMNTMLFFAQRLDELLFHHSLDTYRYPVLSIESICKEYLHVYRDVKNGIMNEANLGHIIEELSFLLQSDSVAINILSKEYVNRFEKNYGQWNIKEQRDNIFYISRKLGNFAYYNGVVDLIKTNVKANSEKRLVDKYCAIVVRLLIDYGYDENYIYNVLHKVFFWREVKSFQSIDDFFDTFNFKPKKFDVYIGFNQDVSNLLPLFQKMSSNDLDISKRGFVHMCG